MGSLKFRPLTENEIECRVNQINQYGVNLLLYKNARCDMNILDETVGAANWQREHYECKGNLFCRVGIYTETLERGCSWIWKSDCGAESYTDKEKGEASDSFKRACVNWGIGRELYTAPKIFIPAEKVNLKQKGDKWTTYDKFEVEKIKIENGIITGLALINSTIEKRCFVFTRTEKNESNN